MKGISPLIATVLLIAFTIAVGGIISIWLTGYTTTTTEIISEESEARIACIGAGISLRDLKFNSTISYLTGNIENTGTVKLGDIDLHILYQNASVEKIPLCLIGGVAKNCTKSNITLSQRDIVSFNVSSGSTYNKIRVTSNCSEATDEAESDEVTVQT
jgi:flagellin-like protein